MNKTFSDEDIKFRISIQRALLREIGPALRGITYTLDINKQLIKAVFYFDGEINSEDIESLRYSETEVMADYDLAWTIEFIAVQMDYPKHMDNFPQGWIYLRREEEMSKDIFFEK